MSQRSNGLTRYEIAAKSDDGRRAFLIAYAVRRSRSGLLDAMRQRGQAIIDRLEIGPTETMTFRPAGGGAAGDLPYARTGSWWIGFTGRTELDAKRCGELPYIGKET